MKQFSNSDKWDVLGLAHSRATEALKRVDLLDFDETNRVVRDFKPHILIHSAAERRPDVVENDEETCMKMNVGVTKALASAINELNSDAEVPEHFMLYISTDYVFDGSSPPYKPLDETNPLNKYGKSKLAGEQVMQVYHPDGGILRVPILYGNVEYLKESAVTGVLSQGIGRGGQVLLNSVTLLYSCKVLGRGNISYLLCTTSVEVLLLICFIDACKVDRWLLSRKEGLGAQGGGGGDEKLPLLPLDL